jgi:hypothetical protein
MKCSNPQFCARSNRLDGCCEPTAEHNIFVKIKSQMSGAITNHPPKINNDWQHGEVGCSATQRRHRQRLAVSVTNLLLGWTLVGWVAAMIWACTADVETDG